MNVAAYYRVSTKGQGEDDRLGLPTQRHAVQRFCSTHEIMRVYEDNGYSGATADRPALAQLLEDASSGLFEAVVVYAWDRIARDTMLDGYIRYRLKALGVTVLSATQTNGIDPTSELTQNILAAVAQFERHLIAQRLSAARRLKKSRGGYAGGKPALGLMVSDGELVPNEAEREALKMARRLRESGKSVRAIAQALNDSGMRSRSGKPWASSTVHKMLMQ